MTVADYYRCTYREFIIKLQGYDILRSHQFENTRAICYLIAVVNWDTTKSPVPSLTEYWKLPTDSDEEVSSKAADYEYSKELIKKARENHLL